MHLKEAEFLKHIFHVTRNEKDKANGNLDDRIGHLHAISMVCGSSFIIEGFTDSVSFVSGGLTKSPVEQDQAKNLMERTFQSFGRFFVNCSLFICLRLLIFNRYGRCLFALDQLCSAFYIFSCFNTHPRLQLMP
jgi:hypothetical protein